MQLVYDVLLEHVLVGVCWRKGSYRWNHWGRVVNIVVGEVLQAACFVPLLYSLVRGRKHDLVVMCYIYKGVLLTAHCSE